MMGASKMNILNKLPLSVIPKTVFLSKEKQENLDKQAFLNDHQFSFPLIMKPDIGERGLLVEKINTLEEWEQYLDANHLDYIVQEYIQLPNEIGIFFYKLPGKTDITISSVCLKDFLSITGNGKSTVRQLLRENFHGRLQLDRLEKTNTDLLEKILNSGEISMLEPIGNHSRGTAFYSGNHLIDMEMKSLIQSIIGSHSDINYGRFDIKYNSIEELKRGINYKVIELNGAASEPTHIYDRSIPIWKKYKIFSEHFAVMYDICTIQMQKGIDPISISAGFQTMKNYYNYKGEINPSWKTV